MTFSADSILFKILNYSRWHFTCEITDGGDNDNDGVAVRHPGP